LLLFSKGEKIKNNKFYIFYREEKKILMNPPFEKGG